MSWLVLYASRTILSAISCILLPLQETLSKLPLLKIKILLKLVIMFLQNKWVHWNSLLLTFSFFLSASVSRPSSKATNQSPSLGQFDSTDFSVDVFQDRVNFANTISTLENEMADENYTPSRMNEDVLPEVANEMHPGIRTSINHLRKFFNSFIFVTYVSWKKIDSKQPNKDEKFTKTN